MSGRVVSGRSVNAIIENIRQVAERPAEIGSEHSAAQSALAGMAVELADALSDPLTGAGVLAARSRSARERMIATTAIVQFLRALQVAAHRENPDDPGDIVFPSGTYNLTATDRLLDQAVTYATGADTPIDLTWNEVEQVLIASADLSAAEAREAVARLRGAGLYVTRGLASHLSVGEDAPTRPGPLTAEQARDPNQTWSHGWSTGYAAGHEVARKREGEGEGDQ